MKILLLVALIAFYCSAVPTEDVVHYHMIGYNYTWYSGISFIYSRLFGFQYWTISLSFL